MANENTPSLGGFDLLSDMLVGGSGIKEAEDGRTTPINEPPLIDPKKIKEELTKSKQKEENEDEDNETDSTEDADDNSDDSSGSDRSDSDSSIKTDKKASGDAPSVDDGTDLSEYEEDITAFFREKLADELGWEFDDEDIPKDVESLVDFMRELVTEASKPRYANEEVQKYDEFVRNGGNLREFYKTAIEGRVDIESVDIETTFDQKRILKEHLGNQGYGEERINKMIKRYEEAGVLEEEASDALELLKEYNSKQEQKLLESQKKFAEEQQKQQQNFITTVEESIKNLNEIRGVKISGKEKQELLEYILVPDSSGLTKYQKDYMSDIRNLVESAYFTKKGDVLIGKATDKGRSDAVKNLHEKLKANKGNRSQSSGTQTDRSTSSALGSLSSVLLGS